jgi:ankyrin repeat protein
MDLDELTLTKNDRFRWVKCQLDVLSKARTTKAVYDALDTLPIGLDETYERILANIDDDDFELASTALKWITCSIRPLNIDELVEAIAVSPGQKKMNEEMRLSDPGDISNICGNLVDLTSKTIGLAHYSVKEFLTSKRLLSKPSRISRYAITIESSHRELGNVCLTYLSFEDFDSGPCRNPEALRVRLKTYPLLGYAARYWGKHSALGDIEVEGHWLNELFIKPGNGMLLNLLEVTSYQDRKRPLSGYEGRYYDDENEGIICIAVRFGFTLLAKKLLDGGADVNAQGGRYGNVLQLAANMNDASLVKLLLEKGASVNAARGYFGNALQAASIGGDLETIMALLEAGSDVNARGGCLETALQAAALNGHVEAVKLFLERGANVNSTGGYHGCALRAATFDSNLEIARMLLEHGADTNAHDNSCRSVLQGAAGSGNYELVKLLLDHGANVNPSLSDDIIDGNREHFSTPLAQAARCGHGDIVRLLLQYGANVNAVDIGTPLSAAVTFGDDVLIDTLLKAGADINGGWSITGNPLSEAVKWRHHEIFKSLLSRGADPNGSGWFTGWGMPLITAAGHGTEEDIQLLIESGANVNATGAFTGTALQEAALMSNVKIARILVDYGADINVQGGVHGSPLLAAASSGNKDLVEILLSLGASTSVTDCFGFNIGHYFKYEWCSFAKHEIMSTWPDDSLSGIDHSKSRETIRACIRAIKDTTVNTFLFEPLARGLLAYGLEDEAATSFERGIRRIGDKGVFVHVGRECDNCDTPDEISGLRYVCKLCWDYDLCKQCHSHVQKSHGVKSGDLHEFLEIPRTYGSELADGAVNKSGEKLNQWLDRLETLFKD